MNMEINPSEYKILIVDDVMSNVLLLKVLLTNEKFAIATASNGRQALEQVDKENPDLVLLDVMMPDMSGFEVAQHLKALFPMVQRYLNESRPQQSKQSPCDFIYCFQWFYLNRSQLQYGSSKARTNTESFTIIQIG